MSRVLLVGKGAPDRGGIPTFLDQLRGGDLARLHDITFLNVAHTGVPQGGAVTIANVVRTAKDVRRVWVAARGQDVVHIHSAAAPGVTVIRAGLLGLAGRARGCGVVLHVHGGNLGTWLDSRRSRLVLRAALRPMHRVVAVWSAGHRALLDVLGEDRVRLVGNGVDVAAFEPPGAAQGPPRVLYVGLLTPRKGVLDLLEASAKLRAEGLEHELHLVGGVPDEGPAAAEPVLEAARGHATLWGTRPPEQMPSAYAGADVFCLPSRWEAMPMSVLEAMAASLPVVATAVGDVPRLVEDGVTGYVVPSGSVDDLVVALGALLADPDRRRRMGEAGRRAAEERFSAAATAAAISGLYDEIGAGRS